MRMRQWHQASGRLAPRTAVNSGFQSAFASRLRRTSRGVAQPGSAPALGEEPSHPNSPTGLSAFSVFNNLGHLLSLEAQPKSIQFREFCDSFATATPRKVAAEIRLAMSVFNLS